jgi:hypothetical protein
MYHFQYVTICNFIILFFSSFSFYPGAGIILNAYQKNIKKFSLFSAFAALVETLNSAAAACTTRTIFSQLLDTAKKCLFIVKILFYDSIVTLDGKMSR